MQEMNTIPKCPDPRTHGGAYILAHDEGLAQRVHFLVVTILPGIAFAIAVGETVAGNLKPWEVTLALVMFGATMSGITVRFHRFLTHRSLQTGPVIYWVG